MSEATFGLTAWWPLTNARLVGLQNLGLQALKCPQLPLLRKWQPLKLATEIRHATTHYQHKGHVGALDGLQVYTYGWWSTCCVARPVIPSQISGCRSRSVKIRPSTIYPQVASHAHCKPLQACSDSQDGNKESNLMTSFPIESHQVFHEVFSRSLAKPHTLHRRRTSPSKNIAIRPVEKRTGSNGLMVISSWNSFRPACCLR